MIFASIALALINTAPSAAPVVLAPDVLARYKTALPHVAYKKLQDIFDSADTMWWDKETIVPSYQDCVGDGSFTPIGARANSQGKGVIVPEGKRLFSADGETWAFPFAHTGGTDRSTNILIINFMHLPIENGTPLPVVYETTDNDGALGGLGLHEWTWMYPKGALLGEVILLSDSAGTLYPAEVRIRTRYIDGWATNVFRPFPTPARLIDAIQRLRPDWMMQNNLRAFIDHLNDNTTLASASESSPAFNELVSFNGYLDELPPLGDEQLVRELLTQTTFISAYADVWKKDGAHESYAASTSESFSVVPNNYEAGLLPVNETTCTQCHQDAGRLIEDFEPAAVLYGDIWGSDQIFSFHPWDEAEYVNFNNENRIVKQALRGIVVPYDPAQHPDRLYRALPRR